MTAYIVIGLLTLYLTWITVYSAVRKALHDDEVAHTKPRIEGER